MIVQVVKVGNSRGVCIPKSLLEQLGIDKEVYLRSTKEGLLLKPVRSKAREGWDKKFQKMAERKDDQLLMPDHVDFNGKDWKW